MNRKARATIEEFSMLRQGDTVTAAVSGGADSVALLDFLCSLTDLRLTVRACHLNHCLRGRRATGTNSSCAQCANSMESRSTCAGSRSRRSRGSGRVDRGRGEGGALRLLRRARGKIPLQDRDGAHSLGRRRDGAFESRARHRHRRAVRHPAGARGGRAAAHRLHPAGDGGLLRGPRPLLRHRQHQPDRPLHPQPHPPQRPAAAFPGESRGARGRRADDRLSAAGRRLPRAARGGGGGEAPPGGRLRRGGARGTAPGAPLPHHRLAARGGRRRTLGRADRRGRRHAGEQPQAHDAGRAAALRHRAGRGAAAGTARGAPRADRAAAAREGAA